MENVTPFEAAQALIEEREMRNDDIPSPRASKTITPAKNNETQANRLIELALESGAVFFKDNLGDAYCAPNGDGSRVIKVRTRPFRLWLRELYWNAEKKAPGREAVETGLAHLESVALFKGDQLPLEVRVAGDRHVIWYDLGEPAVRITPQGWEVVSKPPILFKRYRSQSRQALPQRGGDLFDLLSFTRVKGEESKLIYLTKVVASFIPGYPQPIEGASGDQGSAKSFHQEIQKSLLDPSPTLSMGPPENHREFIQQASHHRMLVLDNLTVIPEWLSNTLCRLSSGSGFSKRELYTDDDDVIYSLQRVVALNGINLVIDKPDLLDRAILFSFERVPDNERLEIVELWERFEEAKPKLLGAIFDTLSSAMAIFPTLHLGRLPRLADFGRWGEAIAQALGYKPGEFEKAFQLNIMGQNDAAIEASLIGQAVITFMEGKDVWTGTPTELLEELTKVAEVLRLDTRDKRWPKGSSWLWRRIKEVRPNLVALRVQPEYQDTARPRTISLTRTGQENADAADAADAGRTKEATAAPGSSIDPDGAVGRMGADQSQADSTVSTVSKSRVGSEWAKVPPTELWEEKF